MKKHTAKKTKDQPEETDKDTDEQSEKLRKLKERSKNYVPERLEVRQREIEEDTMKLLALEKKLEEVSTECGGALVFLLPKSQIQTG
jgi:transposase-like protein